MKILKRNFEHRNVIIFLIFSVVYLQAIYALSKGISFYGVESLTGFLKEHFLILILVLITIFSIVKVHRFSDKALLLCLCLVAGKNFILLSSSFNKLILALNFVYLIFAFYFFIMWELEIEKASFNPGFSRHDLEKEPRFQIKGKFFSNENEFEDVYITNIDETSCFLYFPELKPGKLSTSQRYEIKAVFEGVEFCHKARVVSSYDHGFGLEFERSEAVLNWSELHKVCLERGLFT